MMTDPAVRRRLGVDKRDELWDGVWHFVDPAKMWACRLKSELVLVLGGLAARHGLARFGSVGVFRDLETDWRVPDLTIVKPDDLIDQGVTSAEFLVEVRSPGDESYEKLPFYASCGVTEVLIVNQDHTFELRRLQADGDYELVPDGVSQVLGVTFSTVEGPKVRIEWEGGSAEV